MSCPAKRCPLPAEGNSGSRAEVAWGARMSSGGAGSPPAVSRNITALLVSCRGSRLITSVTYTSGKSRTAR